MIESRDLRLRVKDELLSVMNHRPPQVEIRVEPLPSKRLAVTRGGWGRRRQRAGRGEGKTRTELAPA